MKISNNINTMYSIRFKGYNSKPSEPKENTNNNRDTQDTAPQGASPYPDGLEYIGYPQLGGYFDRLTDTRNAAANLRQDNVRLDSDSVAKHLMRVTSDRCAATGEGLLAKYTPEELKAIVSRPNARAYYECLADEHSAAARDVSHNEEFLEAPLSTQEASLYNPVDKYCAAEKELDAITKNFGKYCLTNLINSVSSKKAAEIEYAILTKDPSNDEAYKAIFADSIKTMDFDEEDIPKEKRGVYTTVAMKYYVSQLTDSSTSDKAKSENWNSLRTLKNKKGKYMTAPMQAYATGTLMANIPSDMDADLARLLVTLNL